MLHREIVQKSMWLINPPERIRGTFSEELCKGLTSFLPQVTASGTHAVLSLPIQDYPVSICLPTTMQNIQRNSILDLRPTDICQTAFVQLFLPLELCEKGWGREDRRWLPLNIWNVSAMRSNGKQWKVKIVVRKRNHGELLYHASTIKTSH